MNTDLPELNSRIYKIIQHYTKGNIKAFASRLNKISQQRLDRIFKIDNRTNKYPSVPDDILLEIARVFPEINTNWLLKGNEEMLIKGNAANVLLSKQESDVTVAPLIGQYAYAGYFAGFSDPEYLDAQPHYTANRKHNGGNYIAFEIRGDSMNEGTTRSICHGDVVLGRELQRVHWKNKFHIPKVFIIVHKTDGIICKEVISHDVENGIITCHSWNPDPEYHDFEIDLKDVMQLFYIKEITKDYKY
jgi:hypothetical protein